MATKSKHSKSLAFYLILAASLVPAAAYADDNVEVARKAFTAGYAEEQAGHFAAALEKFLEVQRVKDTALPASTFRKFPVDFAERSEAKKKTPSAISSGKTDRCNRLRLR